MARHRCQEADVNGEVPLGTSWHSDLLTQMAIEIPEVRSPVIGVQLKENLSECLRFRHVFRNVYGFDLKWEKLQDLVLNIDQVAQDFELSVKNFLHIMQSLDLHGE